MLQNSKYSVWFRTPKGEGYGIISHGWTFERGDNISSYTGTYVQDGDKFIATIAVKRHPINAAPPATSQRSRGTVRS